MPRLSQVLTGKDRVFFDLFEEAAANIVRGADLLDQMLAHYPDRADLSRDIVICEQEGDRITVRKRHRPARCHPLEGHLRAPGGGDRRLRARRQLARGHRHQERVSSDVVLVIVVASALAFDFTNGFHDTANAIATSVSTRAMSPRFAVALSAVLNFAGAFISLKVAATVGSGIVDAGAVTTTVVFAGLVGAIAWNIATWWLGLPSSSSHALIGGLIGSAFAADGPNVIDVDGIVEKVLVPAAVAPVLAFVVAASSIVVIYRMVGSVRPGPVNRGYRLGQIVSGSMFSLAHGTNDA